MLIDPLESLDEISNGLYHEERIDTKSSSTKKHVSFSQINKSKLYNISNIKKNQHSKLIT